MMGVKCGGLRPLRKALDTGQGMVIGHCLRFPIHPFFSVLLYTFSSVTVCVFNGFFFLFATLAVWRKSIKDWLVGSGYLLVRGRG